MHLKEIINVKNYAISNSRDRHKLPIDHYKLVIEIRTNFKLHIKNYLIRRFCDWFNAHQTCHIFQKMDFSISSLSMSSIKYRNSISILEIVLSAVVKTLMFKTHNVFVGQLDGKHMWCGYVMLQADNNQVCDLHVDNYPFNHKILCYEEWMGSPYYI